MNIRKKLFCLLSVIMTVLAVSPIQANALTEPKYDTGDNSTVLIIAIVAIAVAALVIVLLTLFGNKKNKK